MAWASARNADFDLSGLAKADEMSKAPRLRRYTLLLTYVAGLLCVAVLAFFSGDGVRRFGVWAGPVLIAIALPPLFVLVSGLGWRRRLLPGAIQVHVDQGGMIFTYQDGTRDIVRWGDRGLRVTVADMTRFSPLGSIPGLSYSLERPGHLTPPSLPRPVTFLTPEAYSAVMTTAHRAGLRIVSSPDTSIFGDNPEVTVYTITRPN